MKTSESAQPNTGLNEADSRAHENVLRARLGLAPLGEAALPAALRLRGWIVTIACGILAALTRLVGLGHPNAVIFDETYYVKGAYSLATLGYEAEWTGEKANEHFAAGNFSDLGTAPDYVVHPPLGKWLMALGQEVFGSGSGFGWRAATAFFGIASVVLLVRIALRMFHSVWLAGFAGLAMALDGMGITMSRTGILDNILAFFVLLGFWALLRDREHSRARLARRTARALVRPGNSSDGATSEPVEGSVELAEGSTRLSADLAWVPADPWGPHAWYRPWLVVASVALGASCAVKWSGIYAVAVFGIVAFAWGTSARRAVGAKLWFGAGIFREGVPAFVSLVPTTAVTYVAGWTPWFLNPHSWGHDWAAEAKASELISWLPDLLNSWVHYHSTMWSFHHGLSDPHTYQSQMWTWLYQGRPVSFHWVGTETAGNACGSGECVQAITSIGNIAVWWPAIPALALVILGAVKMRDWRAWAIIAGYAAMWLPWIGYTDRTIFQFYAVAFLPFVVLALTYGLGMLCSILGKTAFTTSGGNLLDSTNAEGPSSGEPGALLPEETAPNQAWWEAKEPGRSGKVLIVSVSALVIGVAAFWYPLWTGTDISYAFWHAHMWFASWI